MKLKNLFKNMNSKKDEPLKDQQQEIEGTEEVNGTKDTSETTAVTEESKVIELQNKVAELNDKYLRLYSEFDNYRKRVIKERVELIKSSGEDIFREILPIIDDFERALKSTNEASDIKAVKEGMNLIYNKFKNTLTQKGLEEMVSTGNEFNTDLHEAITSSPAVSEDMKGKVIDELEKGYLLNGKVIRFAKVVVGS